jgi:hypothetical protein
MFATSSWALRLARQSFPQKETGHPNTFGSRLRHWLRPSRRPSIGAGLLASQYAVLCSVYRTLGRRLRASLEEWQGAKPPNGAYSLK